MKRPDNGMLIELSKKPVGGVEGGKEKETEREREKEDSIVQPELSIYLFADLGRGGTLE